MNDVGAKGQKIGVVGRFCVAVDRLVGNGLTEYACDAVLLESMPEPTKLEISRV